MYTYIVDQRTLRDALGSGYGALIGGVDPVLDLVSLRDLRFGLAELPDVTWADALDRPRPSRGQLRKLRERLVHLDSITRFPQPLIVELGELLAAAPGLRSQWKEIATDLWGWDGTGRKSADLVALRHHVTPGRVRHVSQSMNARLTKIDRPIYLPTARAIGAIVTALGGSASRFHVARLAMDQELITDSSELDALEALEHAGLVPAGTWRWGAPVESAASAPASASAARARARARPARRVRRRPPHVAAQLAEFRELISSLHTRRDVYLVELEPTDKPETIRRRLLQVASEATVEIVVRKHADGWVVGLMTPDRRRGRPRSPVAAPRH